MAKVKLNPSLTSVSWRGKEYKPGKDGSVDLPEDAIQLLSDSHALINNPPSVSAPTSSVAVDVNDIEALKARIAALEAVKADDQGVKA